MMWTITEPMVDPILQMVAPICHHEQNYDGIVAHRHVEGFASFLDQSLEVNCASISWLLLRLLFV